MLHPRLTNFLGIVFRPLLTRTGATFRYALRFGEGRLKGLFPLKRIVPEGAALPRGYGCAYYEHRRYSAVCYPIPLNYIVGVARKFWTSLQHGMAHNKWERELLGRCHEAYRSGYRDGKETGVRLAHHEYRRVVVVVGEGKDQSIWYTKDE